MQKRKFQGMVVVKAENGDKSVKQFDNLMEYNKYVQQLIESGDIFETLTSSKPLNTPTTPTSKIGEWKNMIQDVIGSMDSLRMKLDDHGVAGANSAVDEVIDHYYRSLEDRGILKEFGKLEPEVREKQWDDLKAGIDKYRDDLIKMSESIYKYEQEAQDEKEAAIKQIDKCDEILKQVQKESDVIQIKLRALESMTYPMEDALGRIEHACSDDATEEPCELDDHTLCIDDVKDINVPGNEEEESVDHDNILKAYVAELEALEKKLNELLK